MYVYRHLPKLPNLLGMIEEKLFFINLIQYLYRCYDLLNNWLNIVSFSKQLKTLNNNEDEESSSIQKRI